MQSKWKYFILLCGIWGTGRDEMPDLCGCLFSYTVFVMVVTGQCCTVKFHFLKLSIQLFCFFFQCCGLYDKN